MSRIGEAVPAHILRFLRVAHAKSYEISTVTARGAGGGWGQAEISISNEKAVYKSIAAQCEFFVAFEMSMLCTPRVTRLGQAVCDGFFVSMWVSHGTYEWVMAYMSESCHIWISHVTYMSESCHIWVSHVTCEWVVSHMSKSCQIYEWVMSHMKISCHIYKWVVTHMKESWHIWIRHVTYEWVILHMNQSWRMWLSRVTHMNESWHR